jgi:hypothetical protein
VPGPIQDWWGGVVSLDPFDPEAYPARVSEPRTAFSPRIGVSHPLNERSVVYGNYGIYRQQPVYRAFWLGHDGYRIDEEGVAGNPYLISGTSNQYEIGLKRMLTEFHAIEIALWGKNSTGLAGTVHVPEFMDGLSIPWDYSVVVNNGYVNSSGLDVRFLKRYSDYFSARILYSYSTTETNDDYLLEGYHEATPVTGSTVQQRVSRWDRPHRLRASLNMTIPAGVGPEVLGIRPFERLSAGLTWQASSGLPYTPADAREEDGIYYARLPWSSQFDLRIYRDIPVLGKIWSVFADIRNIADRKNVRTVFADSGRADAPLPGATGWSDQYDRSWYYGPPRTIDLGLRIIF